MRDRSIAIIGLGLSAAGLALTVANRPVLAAIGFEIGVPLLLWGLVRDAAFGDRLLSWRKNNPVASFLVVVGCAALISGTFWLLLGYQHEGTDTRKETDTQTAKSQPRGGAPVDVALPPRASSPDVVGPPSQSGSHVRDTQSVDALAAAIASRLHLTQPAQPSHGPYPPFKLGGSLDQKDFFDGYIGMIGVWRSVINPSEAVVDWTDMKNAPLVVSATVLGGSCTIELLDENELTVGTSGLVGLRPDGKTPLARTQIQFPFKRGTGTKKYRLRVRRSDVGGGVDSYAVSGEISFPTSSLGGDPEDWRVANTTLSEWRPVKDFRDAEVNWDDVRDPINVVFAEGTMFLNNPIHAAEGGPLGRGRIRIVDVTDTTPVEVVVSEWGNVGRRTGMGRGNSGMGTPFRLGLLPASGGKRRYRLEVQAQDAVLGATAIGRIVLGH